MAKYHLVFGFKVPLLASEIPWRYEFEAESDKMAKSFAQITLCSNAAARTADHISLWKVNDDEDKSLSVLAIYALTKPLIETRVEV